MHSAVLSMQKQARFQNILLEAYNVNLTNSI